VRPLFSSTKLLLLLPLPPAVHLAERNAAGQQQKQSWGTSESLPAKAGVRVKKVLAGAVAAVVCVICYSACTARCNDCCTQLLLLPLLPAQ
jgi:hypothetical protein